MRTVVVATLVFVVAGSVSAQSNPRTERANIQRAIDEGRGRAMKLLRWPEPPFQRRSTCSLESVHTDGEQLVQEYDFIQKRLDATPDSMLLRLGVLTGSPATEMKTILERRSREVTDAEREAARLNDPAQCKFVINIPGQFPATQQGTTRAADTTTRAGGKPAATSPPPAAATSGSTKPTQAEIDKATAVIDAAGVGLDAMSAHEKKLALRGTTWHTTIGLGFAIVGFPLYTNSSFPKYSAVADGGGVGPALDVTVWPLYNRNYGLGVVLNGASLKVTSSDSVHSSSGKAAGYGLKGYVGRGILALVVEATTQSRRGSSAGAATGEASYSATRLAFGPRIGSAQSGGLEVLFFSEKPSFKPATSSLGKSDSVGVSSRVTAKYFGFQLDYAPNYPPAGSPSYAVSNSGINYSDYIAARFFVQYRSFGKAYGSSR